MIDLCCVIFQCRLSNARGTAVRWPPPGTFPDDDRYHGFPSVTRGYCCWPPSGARRGHYGFPVRLRSTRGYCCWPPSGAQCGHYGSPVPLCSTRGYCCVTSSGAQCGHYGFPVPLCSTRGYCCVTASGVRCGHYGFPVPFRSTRGCNHARTKSPEVVISGGVSCPRRGRTIVATGDRREPVDTRPPRCVPEGGEPFSRGTSRRRQCRLLRVIVSIRP